MLDVMQTDKKDDSVPKPKGSVESAKELELRKSNSDKQKAVKRKHEGDQMDVDKKQQGMLT